MRRFPKITICTAAALLLFSVGFDMAWADCSQGTPLEVQVLLTLDETEYQLGEGPISAKMSLKYLGINETIVPEGFPDADFFVMLRFTDDHGREITSNAELVRYQGRRRFNFKPDLAGSYTLKIRREQRSSRLTDQRSDAVSVVITSGDRQILAPVYDFLGL